MDRPEVFYKYLTPETAKTVLRNHTFRWSAASRFNDPFEFHFPWHLDFDPHSHKDAYLDKIVEVVFSENEPDFVDGPVTSSLRNLRSVRHSIDPAGYRRFYEGFFPQIVEYQKQLKKSIQRDFREEAKSYRLFCLSEVHDNLLMCAHYGQDHTGVVLGLLPLESIASPLLEAHDVRYSREVPTVLTVDEWIGIGAGVFDLDGFEMFKRFAFSKGIDWEYEKEWRVLSGTRPGDKGGYEDCRFEPEEIGSIYLGCRISDQDKDEILWLGSKSYPHAKVFQATQSGKSYRLEFEEIAPPDPN